MDGKMPIGYLRERFPKASEDDLAELYGKFSEFCWDVDHDLVKYDGNGVVPTRENVWEKLVATLKTGRVCVQDGQPARELRCNVVHCTNLVAVGNLKAIYAFDRVEPFDFMCAECRADYS
jgi:hypothetical protein